MCAQYSSVRFASSFSSASFTTIKFSLSTEQVGEMFHFFLLCDLSGTLHSRPLCNWLVAEIAPSVLVNRVGEERRYFFPAIPIESR